ncbi:MAG: hypothetical protein LBJ70_05130 [Holosporales bacterium]|nr:hypothetical protein [Holosporales bacterium]
MRKCLLSLLAIAFLATPLLARAETEVTLTLKAHVPSVASISCSGAIDLTEDSCSSLAFTGQSNTGVLAIRVRGTDKDGGYVMTNERGEVVPVSVFLVVGNEKVQVSPEKFAEFAMGEAFEVEGTMVIERPEGVSPKDVSAEFGFDVSAGEI